MAGMSEDALRLGVNFKSRPQTSQPRPKHGEDDFRMVACLMNPCLQGHCARLRRERPATQPSHCPMVNVPLTGSLAHFG